MKNPLIKATLAVAIGVAAWGIPTLALANTSEVANPDSAETICNDSHSACAWEHNSWAAVGVKDEKCDGNYVHVSYQRDKNGTFLDTYDRNGCGTTAFSGSDPNNLMYRYEACADHSVLPDECSDMYYRPGTG